MLKLHHQKEPNQKQALHFPHQPRSTHINNNKK
jgi:hypothetical protein